MLLFKPLFPLHMYIHPRDHGSKNLYLNVLGVMKMKRLAMCVMIQEDGTRQKTCCFRCARISIYPPFWSTLVVSQRHVVWYHPLFAARSGIGDVVVMVWCLLCNLFLVMIS